MSDEFTIKESYQMDDWVKLVRRLRSENGCPWDREQDHHSIRKNFLEETYEVLEAIDTEDTDLLKEELGDVLLQVVFHAQMETEKDSFDFDSVCDGICKKLVQIGKRIIVKLVKMLISLFLSLAEIIIPAALVILIIVALGSIFGSSSSEKDIENYSNYMASIQEEYNRQVDDWVKDNPDGIVVGVKGNYGQIDWRIPLGIIQSTGAELKFDQDEKNLLESFKNADLFEKHEVYNQTI